MVQSIVYNEDNLYGMGLYPDNYFSLAVVDPPYFSGPEKRKFYGNAISPLGVERIDYPVIDEWELPSEEYFKELFRISKHQIIWGCNYFDYPFGPGRIIWDKVNGKSSFSDCEIAYCSLHNSVRLFRFMWNGFMQGKSIEEGHIQQGNKKLNEKRIHQTQKPIALYDWTFQKYTKPGDRILDTHVGSGSSRIAAYKAGLDFTGFEINPIHYQNQDNRFIDFKNSFVV